MSYEVINQEHEIYSCNIVDLTPEQKESILKSWGGDYPIEELTVFNDEDGKIIINKECKDYEKLKEIICDYTIMYTDMERKEFREEVLPNAPSVKTIIDIIDNVLRYREAKKWEYYKKIVGKQDATYGHVIDLKKNLFDTYGPGNTILGIINVYNYGVIQGKRAERAKRKKLQSEVTV